MLSVKSLKYIQALKTQKMIREQAQKQDFFDNLLTQIQQQFRPEEYEYLVGFVIPPKREPKDMRKRPIQSINNFCNLDSKENTCVVTARETARTMRKVRSVKRVLTECNQPAGQSQDCQVNVSGSLSRRGKRTVFGRVDNPSQTARESSRFKFKEIKLADRSTREFKKYCISKLAKRTKQQHHLSQKAKRSYNESFLQEVLQTQLNPKQSMPSTDFDQAPLLFENKPQFWQREKEQELKFRHLTSAVFKHPRNHLRIFTRRF